MEISQREVENIKTSELLIEKLHDYVELLGEEINELLPYAYVNGWESSQYKRGKELREEIEQLKKKIND